MDDYEVKNSIEENSSEPFDNLIEEQGPVPEFVEWSSEETDNRGLIEGKSESFSVPQKEKKQRGNTRPKTISSCEICGIVLYYPSKIKEHMRTHTGEKPFQCDICGARFSQRTPMVNHFREHMGDLPYTCSFGCGKRFVNNSRKNAHELRHVGMNRSGPPRPHLKPPRRLICPPLNDDVARSDNLSNSAVANYIPAPLYEEQPSTSEQPTAFPLDDYNEHSEPTNLKLGLDLGDTDLQAKNSREDGVVVLDLNSKEKRYADSQKRIDDVIETVLSKCLAPPINPDAKNASKVKKTRKYNSSRPVTVAQCTICGLMIRHPSKIAEHVRTHSGEKPFQCGECGMSLTKATSLKLHIRRKHTNVRPFACEWECGMSFVSEACKTEHEKLVHSGLKRYECLIEGCSASFSRRAYMMKHRKVFHNDVFTPIFNDVQVTNEEAADESQHEAQDHIIIYDNEEHLMMLNDNDRIITEPFDEEEFVEQALTAK